MLGVLGAQAALSDWIEVMRHSAWVEVISLSTWVDSSGGHFAVGQNNHPLVWPGLKGTRGPQSPGSSSVGSLKCGTFLYSFPGVLAQGSKSHVTREEVEAISISSIPKVSAPLAFPSRFCTDSNLLVTFAQVTGCGLNFLCSVGSLESTTLPGPAESQLCYL